MSSHDSDFAALEERTSRMEDEVHSLKQELKKNTEATQRVEKNTDDIVEAFNNAKAAYKVLEHIGKFGRVILIIAGIPSALWGAYLAIKALVAFTFR